MADWMQINSSNLVAIKHEVTTLSIKFKNNKVYEYSNFSEKNWVKFRDCDSRGKYFHSHIKNNYKAKKI